MDKIKLVFPDGRENELEKGKPLVILGANGAGKTRFSVKLEELNDPRFGGVYESSALLVQRISAQKSLSLAEGITIRGLETAERVAYVGGEHEHATKLGYRFLNTPATAFLSDYDKVLSLFFARNNKLVETHHTECRHAQLEGKTPPKASESLIEKATRLWKRLLPKRKLDLSGNDVHVVFGEVRYHGKEMSDGERVILYMIAQVLSIKCDSVIIIDEPEMHIHKAIMNRLWDELEEMRQDCVFIYLTHDLDFAASRNTGEVLWIKSFDGNERWDYEFLSLDDLNELPAELLFEIMGSHKKIVFVEGTESSFDYQIYRKLLKEREYHVIPCGGCSQVIRNVRAKKEYSRLNHLEVYGVIDRDYRTDKEIEALESDGIFVLGVAEIENLFIVPELLSFMQLQLGCEESVADEIQDQIKNTIYKGRKPQEIHKAFLAELTYQLNTIDLGEGTTTEVVEEHIKEKTSSATIQAIYENKKNYFDSITDYVDILRVFNDETLSNSFDRKFGLQKGEYREKVLRLLHGQEAGAILKALERYIPDLP